MTFLTEPWTSSISVKAKVIRMASTAAQKKKRKRLIKKTIIWSLLLLLLAAVGYLVVWPKMTAGATITYDKYNARIGSITNALSFSGSVSVKNNETHSAEGAATVRQIFVKEEQMVRKDDKLMRLSDGTNIKASFDGQVNAISVEVGDEVGMGDSLIQIVDFQNMTVSLRVDEYDISSVKVGQECNVTVKALGETFPSTISHINRVSSSMGNTAYYSVTAELSVSENVLPGMQVTVSIPQEEALDTVILRQDALSFAANNSAYVLMYDENNVLQQVPVELGISNDSYVEIKAGLKNGDEVYKVAKTQTDAGGLFSSLTSLMGGGQQGGMQNFGGGSMPSFGGGSMPDFGGGGMPSFGGGSRNGSGMGGGGMGGGSRR